MTKTYTYTQNHALSVFGVKCVRLSRPLVGFCTHFKSLHFHFI